jgi:type II secretory pathway pseudopilin PulG
MDDRRKVNRDAGFALVEILMAILILGTSFVTLLSLHSTAVQRTLRDRNQKNAMLVARSIMSAIEVDPDQVEPQDTTMFVNEMLDQLLPSRSDVEDEELKEFLARFEANLRVEEVLLPIAGQDPVLMKKIMLLIFWGDGPSEQLETLFFVRQG